MTAILFTSFKRGAVAIAVLLSAVSATATFGQHGGPPSPVRVDAVRVEPTVEQRLVTGDIKAVVRSQVATREPGLVMSIPVLEGHSVAAGEELALLDDARLQIQLIEAQSKQRVAEARRDQRLALLEQAKRDAKLVQESFDRGAANPREVLNAETDVQAAEADLAEAAQEIEVAKAQAQLLSQRIADMKISAPFDGIVTAKFTEPGQWVSEGDALVEIISTGMVEAWLNVPQRYLQQVRRVEQSSSTIAVEAGGELVQGSFDRLVPDVHPSARMFRLVVRLPDVDGTLAPGMSITGWVPTGVQANRPTVHKNAVLRNDAGTFVYVIRPGSEGDPMQAVPVQIRVLFPQGQRYVIESDGLNDGDEIIIEGNERLFPYSPVQPVRDESTDDGKGRDGSE